MDYAELAKRLRAWVKQDDMTDGRGPLPTDIRLEAADAIEALTSPPDEAQVEQECDDCSYKDAQITAMLRAAYASKIGPEIYCVGSSIIEAYKHANDEEEGEALE